jgi:hypothetical protein
MPDVSFAIGRAPASFRTYNLKSLVKRQEKGYGYRVGGLSYNWEAGGISFTCISCFEERHFPKHLISTGRIEE